MGKGRVITDHGEGRYTIELIEDRLRAASSRAIAVARIDAIDTRLITLEEDVADAQQIVDQAATEQDAAIDQYQAELAEEGESEIDLAAFAAALLEAAGKRDAIRSQINQLKVERLALQSRIARADALPALRQVEAWCADLTEDLAGDVGTAEVPGEAKQVLVHPGHDGAAAYDQARDGALQPALSGTPAGVFYNLAMLPGWQKWRPTYRIATITDLSMSADTCAIDIVPATSSQQGLNVNAEPSYTGVPIQYMTCNANAFEVGDRVLVRFDRQDQSPTVIGFESEPRGCGIDTIVAVPITLYYNDDFPFSINSECACDELTPTPGMIYTARAMSSYIWRLEFDQGSLVFSGEGKRAQALQSPDRASLPQPDDEIIDEEEIFGNYRTLQKYPYDFPVSEGGVCTYEQDEFSRLAISDDTPEVGGGEQFFNGELSVHDNGSGAQIELDGETFTAFYEPALRQEEWHSAEHGVYTVGSGSDGTCSALFLLSKERQASTSYGANWSIATDTPGAIRRFPGLTIDGKEKRPLAVFHLIEGENTFSFDTATFRINGVTRVFDLRRERRLYLLVGYGR